MDGGRIDTFYVAVTLIFVVGLSSAYILGSSPASGGDGNGVPSSPEITSFNFTAAGCATGSLSDSVKATLHGSGPSHSITVNASVITSDPCHSLNASLERVDRGVYDLLIRSEADPGVCVQCIGEVEYTTRIDGVRRPFTLNVFHDGRRVDRKKFD